MRCMWPNTPDQIKHMLWICLQLEADGPEAGARGRVASIARMRLASSKARSSLSFASCVSQRNHPLSLMLYGSHRSYKIADGLPAFTAHHEVIGASVMLFWRRPAGVLCIDRPSACSKLFVPEQQLLGSSER